MRARQSRSIKMLALEGGTGLAWGRGSRWRLNTYPFQVPVYHVLIVHIYQSLGDVFELLWGHQ